MSLHRTTRQTGEMDLSVAVTPLYVASMVAENKALKARAATEGPSAADYVAADTRTSLGMGFLSVTTPLTMAATALLVPRRGPKGRLGRIVVAATALTALATTIADRIAARPARDERERRRVESARRVARVGGVATVAAVGTLASATSSYVMGSRRQWALRRRDLGKGPLAWLIALVGWDLGYYWNHRLMHEVRGLWAVHVPHHSSEHYNLSTALRQPVAGAFGVWVPYGAMARLGVRPSIIETSRSLNLIYQYWIHTDTIRTLGAAEEVLNTPSHHRVHHGSNQRYLDRNHAGVLIIWDRLFGTFQREQDDDPVVYGLTENIESHDLWTVSTHEYRAMFRDVARSTNWRDRFGFVLRSPRWCYARRAELDAADAAEAIASAAASA